MKRRLEIWFAAHEGVLRTRPAIRDETRIGSRFRHRGGDRSPRAPVAGGALLTFVLVVGVVVLAGLATMLLRSGESPPSPAGQTSSRTQVPPAAPNVSTAVDPPVASREPVSSAGSTAAATPPPPPAQPPAAMSQAASSPPAPAAGTPPGPAPFLPSTPAPLATPGSLAPTRTDAGADAASRSIEEQMRSATARTGAPEAAGSPVEAMRRRMQPAGTTAGSTRSDMLAAMKATRGAGGAPSAAGPPDDPAQAMLSAPEPRRAQPVDMPVRPGQSLADALTEVAMEPDDRSMLLDLLQGSATDAPGRLRIRFVKGAVEEAVLERGSAIPLRVVRTPNGNLVRLP